jgi:hypothetical protein
MKRFYFSKERAFGFGIFLEIGLSYWLIIFFGFWRISIQMGVNNRRYD